MSVPRTGSLGIGSDLWALCNAACYEPHPVKGHEWLVPEEIAKKVAVTDEAFDSGIRYGDEVRVPFSPKCTTCRRAARRVLTLRGLTQPRIESLFRSVGAKWDWTNAEKAAARRDSDHGVAVIDPEGPGVVLDSTVKARMARRARRLVQDDFKAKAIR